MEFVEQAIEFKYNDGGRKEIGYKGDTGDCAVRAISIATGTPYKEIYDKINELGKEEKVGKRKKKKSNARTGVYAETVKKYMTSIGWVWIPCMTIGSGCTMHLKFTEVPKGRIVVRLTKHFAAVIDGVLNDTYDCSRNGTRCVYGYWTKK